MTKNLYKNINRLSLRSLLIAIMAIILFTNPVAGALYSTNSPTFTDVDVDNWARVYIDNLYSKGIISGYPEEGKFRPSDSLRRGQVAKMITLAAGLDYKGKEADFKDIEKEHEMYEYIAALVYKGAIRGFEDGTFKMHENITRRQIAQIVVEAFNLSEGDIKTAFGDIKYEGGHYAKILASNGIVKGYNNNTKFDPNAHTTRAQFTKILSVAMAVSAVQEAEEIRTSEAITIAQKLVNSLPKDEDGETTRVSLLTRLVDIDNSLFFIQSARALPSVKDINVMEGPGLNRTNEMIEAITIKYEALSEKMKKNIDVVNAYQELNKKKNEIIKTENLASSIFVTTVESLPSVTAIQQMNLSQLDEANTLIESARAKYVVLSNKAKKDQKVISSERNLKAREDAIYNTYIKKATTGEVNKVTTYSNFNQTLEDQVVKQMKVSPQTDYRGGGWKHATETEVRFFLDPNNFTGDVLGWARINCTSSGLSLRSGPGANHDIVGKLQNGELYPVIEESNGWYKLKTKNETGWVPKTYAIYTPMSNNSMLQFLDLSKPANVNPIYLNKFAESKGILAGQGSNYKASSQQYSINEIYLLSHSFLETGHGRSQLASGLLVDKNGRIFDNYGRYVNSFGNFVDEKGNRLKSGQGPVIAQGPYTTVYNMFGIGAVDADPLMRGAQRAFEQGWTSVDKAIRGGTAFVAKDYVYNSYNQNTLYKMRWNPGNLSDRATKQYATDIGWAYKQVNTMSSYYSQSSGYTLYFDIPVYKAEPLNLKMFEFKMNFEQDSNIIDQEEQEVFEDKADVSEEELITEDVAEPITADDKDEDTSIIDEVDDGEDETSSDVIREETR